MSPPRLKGHAPLSRRITADNFFHVRGGHPACAASSGSQLISPCWNTIGVGDGLVGVGWVRVGITSVRVTEVLWVGCGAWTACAVPMPRMKVSVVTMVAVMRLMSCPIFAG